MLCFSVFAQAQIVDIPDPVFLQFLIDEGIDANGDGQIQNSEAETVTELESLYNDIFDFQGILAFTNLERLIIRANLGADMINISGLDKLQYLDLSESTYSGIDARDLTSLDTMLCQDCHGATVLDLTGASSLKMLSLDGSDFPDIDLSSLPSLETFNCNNCMITTANFKDAPTLKNLHLENSRFFELDVSGLENLEILDCENCTEVNFVNLEGANALREVNINYAYLLTELDIADLDQLEILRCSYNQLESLTVDNLTNLKVLECNYNMITELNVSSLINLEVLDCSNNLYINQLDVSNLSQLTSLICSNNDSIAVLDVADKVNLTVLDCGSNTIAELDVSNLVNLTYLHCGDNEISNLDVTNLVNLEFLDCSRNEIASLDIQNLTKLTILRVNTNELSTININNIEELEELNCRDNMLTILDLSQQDSLTRLYCSSNQLGNMDFSNLSILEDLDCAGNLMTELHLADFEKLLIVGSGQESLLSMSVSNCPKLEWIDAAFPEGNLEVFEYDNCPMLFELHLANLKLRTLDVQHSENFINVTLSNNNLQTLYLKNGSYDWVIIDGNPDLYFICADEDEIADLQTNVDDLGLSDVTINSYCPHSNLDQPYVIQGKSTFDANENGCDAMDSKLPNLKFNITDGTAEAVIVTNESGNYTINVHEGTHTITPVLEYSSSFSIEPESFTVDFPTSDSPFTLDFCISPIGAIDDVEVYIVPIDEARPGFDTKYKIVFKNKGHSIQSGEVRLFYPGMLMDLIEAEPTAEMETGNLLFWSYEDLLPLEKREIFFTMGLNSPMDDPPINGDDVLSFIANITLDDGDDIEPGDNQDIFRQTVVNSFDPNDKTCLNGAHIEPELVGEFVRYMIRFENTGTADAINIVVRDSIDPVAFDINTLVPIDASHDMRTQINGNVVEFIFADIHLPFDDATNDGYIVFKVRTRASLVLGDVLENTAAIYFDYNFPIITNTTTTTVAIPDDVDEVNSNIGLDIYPNPAKQVLNISSTQEIKSLSILDISGREVFAQNGNDATGIMELDLSELQLGMYIIQVFTEEGTSSRKLFIEE